MCKKVTRPALEAEDKLLEDDIKWLIGIASGVMGTWLASGGFVLFKVLSRISKVEEGAKHATDAVNERVTKVREETVHKSDLTDVETRLSRQIQKIEDQHVNMNNSTNHRLDQLLGAIADRNNRKGSSNE